MTDGEIHGKYGGETGKGIVETFKRREVLHVPGVLVKGHGPFNWGRDPHEAVHNAVVMEEVAKMALITFVLSPAVGPISEALLDKHFLRKHGPNAYYGQK